MTSAWKAASGVVPRLRDEDGYRLRAAGVCLRGEGKEMRVLVVSTRDGQWAIPGGGVEDGEAHGESAARELEEEAGVRAVPVKDVAVIQDDGKKSKTSVFLMEAKEELDVWEEGQLGRKRKWLLFREAAEVLKKGHFDILKKVLDM